ncbi:NADH-quinone oxidoreductase subunit F [bacterium]|nr:NADH-quinone oxidoreductase subunit F [bacterium]
MKTAIIIGATGLIGRFLTIKLLKDVRYDIVKVFVRRSMGITNPKLEEHIVDFDNIELWKNKIVGDELFSAMGTTIKKAGNKETQYKIDFTYQYEVAIAASENGVEKFLLVSSVGANPIAGNFYLRIKGKLEERVLKLSFKKIFIFKPSILLGKRNEKRSGEQVGIFIAKVITGLVPFIKKFRPIDGETVADAMINSANDMTHGKVMIYKLDQIFQIAL